MTAPAAPRTATTVGPVFVAGLPVSQGSKDQFRNRYTGRLHVAESAGERLKAWRELITIRLRDPRREPFAGPVSLVCHFVLYRPKRYGPRTPTPPAIKKPDGDKLLRAVMDAATTARVWHDDAQCTSFAVHKCIAEYGEQPGAWITFYGGPHA